MILLGWAGSNSVAFGEYILNAANVEVTRWNQRGIGLACITAAFLVHGLALQWGLRLQNFLGVVKLLIILLIICAGFAALAGHVRLDEKPDNFTNAFEGTTGSAYGVVTALYNVIWSYIGYSNANYAMSEMKNPVRTLKRAAPIAIITIGILYMLVNIAYFAAVPREELANSGRILAASFFRNVFGPTAERALSVFVALSAVCSECLLEVSRKEALADVVGCSSATCCRSSFRKVDWCKSWDAKASCRGPASLPRTSLSRRRLPVCLSTGWCLSSSCSPLPLEMPTTSFSTCVGAR